MIVSQLQLKQTNKEQIYSHLYFAQTSIGHRRIQWTHARGPAGQSRQVEQPQRRSHRLHLWPKHTHTTNSLINFPSRKSTKDFAVYVLEWDLTYVVDAGHRTRLILLLVSYSKDTNAQIHILLHNGFYITTTYNDVFRAVQMGVDFSNFYFKLCDEMYLRLMSIWWVSCWEQSKQNLWDISTSVGDCLKDHTVQLRKVTCVHVDMRLHVWASLFHCGDFNRPFLYAQEAQRNLLVLLLFTANAATSAVKTTHASTPTATLTASRLPPENEDYCHLHVKLGFVWWKQFKCMSDL